MPITRPASAASSGIKKKRKGAAAAAAYDSPGACMLPRIGGQISGSSCTYVVCQNVHLDGASWEDSRGDLLEGLVGAFGLWGVDQSTFLTDLLVGIRTATSS